MSHPEFHNRNTDDSLHITSDAEIDGQVWAEMPGEPRCKSVLLSPENVVAAALALLTEGGHQRETQRERTGRVEFPASLVLDEVRDDTPVAHLISAAATLLQLAFERSTTPTPEQVLSYLKWGDQVTSPDGVRLGKCADGYWRVLMMKRVIASLSTADLVEQFDPATWSYPGKEA